MANSSCPDAMKMADVLNAFDKASMKAFAETCYQIKTEFEDKIMNGDPNALPEEFVTMEQLENNAKLWPALKFKPDTGAITLGWDLGAEVPVTEPSYFELRRAAWNSIKGKVRAVDLAFLKSFSHKLDTTYWDYPALPNMAFTLVEYLVANYMPDDKVTKPMSSPATSTQHVREIGLLELQDYYTPAPVGGDVSIFKRTRLTPAGIYAVTHFC